MGNSISGNSDHANQMRGTNLMDIVMGLPKADPELFDKRRFAELLREMKGDLSVRVFAKKTNLSDSFLSKMTNMFCDSPPSKKSMTKLLNARMESSVDQMELLEAAGYLVQGIDWANVVMGKDASKVDGPTRDNEDSCLICGRLMRYIAEHGASGNFTASIDLENDYFEITDNVTNQNYVGINGCCDTYWDVAAVANKSLSISFLMGKIASLCGASEKKVFIMTNTDKLFVDFECVNGHFEAVTVVVMDEYGNCVTKN